MSLIFTQLASDNFTRANESPLNPANWTVSPELDSSSLAVLNNKCVVQSGGPDLGLGGAEFYTGIVSPNDQYCAATVAAFDLVNAPGSNGAIALRLRSDLGATTYFSITVQGNGNGLTSSLTVVNEPDETIGGSVNISGPNLGDVILAAVVGNVVSVYLNGVLVSSFDFTADPIASGVTGLRMDDDSGQTLTEVSLFVTGGASQVILPPRASLPIFGTNKGPIIL